MAECAYAAIFATRDSHGKTVKDLFPMLFEDDDEDYGEPADPETVAMLQAEMAAMNAERPAGETAGTVAENENNSE